MKIAFFHNFNSYKANKGYAVHVQQLTSALMKRGHSILTYFSLDETPEFKYYRRRHLFRFLRDIDIIYMRISGNTENYTLFKLLRPFSLPIVWEINAPEGEAKIRDNASNDKIKKAIRKRRRLAKLVDACICVSEELRDYIMNELSVDNVFVVENASNPRLFSPEKSSPGIFGRYKDSFKVLWMGGGSAWHGIDIIMKVAKKIHKIDKDIIFIIIGNPKKGYLEIFENVVFMGLIEYLKLPPYITSCDVGLGLYHDIRCDGLHDFPGSLKIFDYMSSGLATIVTDTGRQMRKVIKDGENGLLTNNDPDDIIQKILKLKKDPSKAKKMGLVARKKIVDYYNWDRAACETEAIFYNLLYKYKRN